MQTYIRLKIPDTIAVNNKMKNFSDRPGVLEKTDPGDDKPTYFRRE